MTQKWSGLVTHTKEIRKKCLKTKKKCAHCVWEQLSKLLASLPKWDESGENPGSCSMRRKLRKSESKKIVAEKGERETVAEKVKVKGEKGGSCRWMRNEIWKIVDSTSRLYQWTLQVNFSRDTSKLLWRYEETQDGGVCRWGCWGEGGETILH